MHQCLCFFCFFCHFLFKPCFRIRIRQINLDPDGSATLTKIYLVLHLPRLSLIFTVNAKIVQNSKKAGSKFCVFVFTNNIFSIKGQFWVNISHGTKYKMPLSFLPNFPQLCFIFSDRKKFFHSLHSNITLLYL